MGRLYVIDGLDGSGKSTQAERIFSAFQKAGKSVRLISYPNYEEESSALVRMYLNGEFSSDPNAVNAYAASSFYAVDRYAGYLKHWKADYDANTLIIAARYVSSNAIHQMPKLKQAEWNRFLSWLQDYEYDKLGLPRPNKVFFLDMPRVIADRLLLERCEGDRGKEDIHERNRPYLEACQEAAFYAARREGWAVIPCAVGNEPKPMEEITNILLNAIKKEEEE